MSHLIPALGLSSLALASARRLALGRRWPLPLGVTLRNLVPQGCVGLPSMEDGYDGQIQPSAER